MTMLYPIVLETEDNGAVSAYVPGLPVYAAADSHAKAEREIPRSSDGIPRRPPDEPAGCSGSRGTVLSHRQTEGRDRRRRRSGRREADGGKGARIEGQRPARGTSCEERGHAEENIALRCRQIGGTVLSIFRPPVGAPQPDVTTRRKSGA